MRNGELCTGFVFGYEDSDGLGKSQFLDSDSVGAIRSEKHNNDDVPLFVKCNACGEYMDFHTGEKGKLDGYWSCPTCQAQVKEVVVYEKLDQENQEYLKNNNLK